MLQNLACLVVFAGALGFGSACGHKSTGSTTSPVTSSGGASDMGSATGSGDTAGSAGGSAAPAAATCESAGGKCVGLTPTACPDGKVGDAKQYSCGGGLGVECCLPK